MGDQPQPSKESPEELEFRKKNEWHSFAGAAWGGLAGASFFGALISLTQGLVATASSWSAGAGANEMLAASSSVLGIAPLTVLAGLAAFGLFATYMSQREATEVRILQDEHMAKQNAKCAAPNLAQSQSPPVEVPKVPNQPKTELAR